MSRIGLTSGFQLVPEGKQIFKITAVNYDEQFGKMKIRMTTPSGISHEEKFSLLDNNSQPNERAFNAFSYFAKTATHNYENREIDTDELVGCYIGATAEYTVQPNRNNPEKTITFVNLHDYFEASGFDENVETEEAPAPAPKPAATSAADILKSLGL